MTSEITRVIWSRLPWALDRTRTYSLDTDDCRVFKPNGLWYSCEGAAEDDMCWRSWCQAEDFNTDALTFRTEITVDVSRILCIRDVAQLDAFVDRFGMNPKRGGYIAFSPYPRGSVSWLRVSQHYDGIEIAPYLWGRRLDGPLWYYGWDCASGCIWNLDAVTHVASSQLIAAQTKRRRIELE